MHQIRPRAGARVLGRDRLHRRLQPRPLLELLLVLGRVRELHHRAATIHPPHRPQHPPGIAPPPAKLDVPLRDRVQLPRRLVVVAQRHRRLVRTKRRQPEEQRLDRRRHTLTTSLEDDDPDRLTGVILLEHPLDQARLRRLELERHQAAESACPAPSNRSRRTTRSPSSPGGQAAPPALRASRPSSRRGQTPPPCPRASAIPLLMAATLAHSRLAIPIREPSLQRDEEPHPVPALRLRRHDPRPHRRLEVGQCDVDRRPQAHTQVVVGRRALLLGATARLEPASSVGARHTAPNKGALRILADLDLACRRCGSGFVKLGHRNSSSVGIVERDDRHRLLGSRELHRAIPATEVVEAHAVAGHGQESRRSAPCHAAHMGVATLSVAVPSSLDHGAPTPENS
jgi:hypothetical protein